MTFDTDSAWGTDPGPITDYQASYVPRNVQAKPKRKGATPEAKVLKACAEYLESIGCYVSRTGAGLVTVENRTISMGRTGGLDLTCCTPHGCYLAVDAKSAKGKPSAAQLKQRDLIEARGGTAVFPRSVQELRAALCAAYGPDRVASWETAAAAKDDAKAQRREALMQKMGQKK